MNTIMKTSMIIWFILSATIKMNAQYSDVHCKQHPQSMQITQIDYREYSTIIHFKYINYFEGGGWMNIGENSYLKDKNTNKRYKLLNSINIPINSEGENRYMIFDSKDQIHYFSLEFEKLPDSTIEFDMVEDENNKDAFNFYGITLNPEVKKDFINIDDYIASTPVKEYGIYMKDGQSIYYFKHQGLLISLYLTLNNSYGKYYTPYIDIQNFTGRSLLFNPLSITAKTYDKNKEVVQDLEVLSYEQYMKKVKNKQAWSAALYGMAQGLAASGAGYSSSTTNFSGNGYTSSYTSASGFIGNTYGYMNATASSYSTVYGKSHTQSYNGAAAYAAQQNASNNTNAYLQQQYQIKAQINEGYAKVNTLQNQTQYAGYFNIKYKKSDNMVINIPINNTIYTFQLSWNND